MTKASNKKAGRKVREEGDDPSVSGLKVGKKRKRSTDTRRDAASVTSRAKESAPQCVAHKKNGERCKAAPIRGGTVCRAHGGAAKHVRAAAQARLLAAADRLMAALLEIAMDKDQPSMVRLAAIRDALTRAGLVDGKMPDQTEDDPWSELLAGGLSDDRSLPGSDAEVERSIEAGNVLQVARDARDENWRDIRREDAEEYERGRIYPDENTIQGKVVGDSTWSPLDDHDASQASGPSQHDPRPQGPPSESGYAAYERRLAEAAEDEAERRGRSLPPLGTRPREPRR